MKSSADDMELVERYFDHGLTDEEMRMVEARVKSDPEFEQTFAREKLLINTIRFEGALEDLNFLKEKEQTLGPGMGRPLNMKWIYLAAAACAALIALAVLMPSGKDSPADVYIAYYKPYPNVFEPTLRGDAGVELRREAFQAYEQADYEKASELFSRLIGKKKEPGMLLLSGNANMMLGRTSEAEANLTELLQDFDDLDVEASWYLGLLYLRAGEKQKARENFQAVAAGENIYREKARAILKGMQ